MRKFWAVGTLAAFILVSGSLQAAARQQGAKPTVQKPAAKAAGVEKEDDERGEQEQAKAYTIKVQLPAPVTAAFKKAYPNATIRGTAKEAENGKTVYEVESVEHGRSRDLIYGTDGQVLEVEEQIDPADLPAPVTASLKKMYPAAKVALAEKLTRGKTIRYELTLKGAAKQSVSFTPEGKPVPPEEN